MNLQMEQLTPACLLVHMRGRLDVQHVGTVKTVWADNPGVITVIVEMSATEFIDSMGLATLVNGLKTTRQRGGTLIIANPSEAVQVILELTAMNRALQVVPTVADALALATA